MRAVDTNLLVRIVVRDDEVQARAADAFISAGAWVPHVVLVETVWVLQSAFEKSHSEVAAALDLLLEHESLALQEPEVVAAALASYRERPSLGFSDCFILAIVQKAGHVPLGTFDRSFSKLGDVVRVGGK